MRSPATKGFTLVEVMVALAIVALALPALLVALSSQIDATGYLRDKSLAHVVAENKLAELRLLSRVRQELFKGKESGSEEMAGREWYWWLESAATEVPDFYRVEIDVALDQGDAEEPLYTLVAFLSGDLASLQDDTEEQPGG
ncbi:type II secretion system protein GspI [Halioglobus maricola]|uniref:Type II secretion system protein I n=1 Tax=Halioglobus maricola TaxID=2601894 RepID=A0A5P9NGT6_9GAMM|nr:type II secretion system minor pseudopilin GspI [Halioglobus maricola]QFU75020.1 type II secretion system protein GspI [Halioglobus maricola]